MELRIAATGGPPYVADCVGRALGLRFRLEDHAVWPQRCPHPGIVLEFMREVCLLLAWSCPVLVLDGPQWGGNASGTWTGAVRLIMDGVVHTAGPSFNPTPARQAVIGFSDLVYSNPIYLFTNAPRPTFSLGMLMGYRKEVDDVFGDLIAMSKEDDFRLLRTEVWLLLLLSAVALGSISLVAERLWLPRPAVWDMGVWDRAGWLAKELAGKGLYFLSILFQQSVTDSRGLSAAKMVLGTWCLSCVVLIGTYSAFILASALNDFSPPPFTDAASFANCIGRGRCQLHFEVFSWLDLISVVPLYALSAIAVRRQHLQCLKTLSTSFAERILNAPPEDKGLYAVRQELKYNPVALESESRTMSRIRSSEGSVYHTTIGSSVLLSKLVLSAPVCSLYTAPAWLSSARMPLPKAFGKTKEINGAIQELQQAGLVAKILDKYFMHALERQRDCEKGRLGAAPLSVRGFLGTFVLLAANLSLAVGVLVLESFSARNLELGAERSVSEVLMMASRDTSEELPRLVSGRKKLKSADASLREALGPKTGSFKHRKAAIQNLRSKRRRPKVRPVAEDATEEDNN